MSHAPLNQPASIHRRLLNRARERGEDPRFVLPRHAAERFLYRLGERNDRFKDFCDLCVLTQRFAFDAQTLAQSIRATFERQRTSVDPAFPVALTRHFYADSDRSRQWRSYLDRNSLPSAPADFDQVGERPRQFRLPLWEKMAPGEALRGSWTAGGGWE